MYKYPAPFLYKLKLLYYFNVFIKKNMLLYLMALYQTSTTEICIISLIFKADWVEYMRNGDVFNIMYHIQQKELPSLIIHIYE